MYTVKAIGWVILTLATVIAAPILAFFLVVGGLVYMARVAIKMENDNDS